MGLILRPYQYEDFSGPLIFLAGPIQGALDWQSEAIQRLSLHSELHLASPRWALTAQTFDYDAQVEWEHHHLTRAAREGVTLFWLAREAEVIPGRAYAQTTRFELGEAVTLHRLQGSKLVIGIEDGFSGARYIKKTLRQKAPNVQVCDTLEEACLRASALCR